MNIFKNNKLAFTLAEVLITLGIIGIISAITIPNLIQKQQEQRTVTALKKAYSTLSSAYSLAVQENGTPEYWGIIQYKGEQVINNLLPYLQVSKNCGKEKGCFSTPIYTAKGLTATDIDEDAQRVKIQLADGMLVASFGNSSDCTAFSNNVCGSYAVDINGLKKPNKFGTDIFIFWITKRGIIPSGTKQDGAYTFNGACKDIKNSYTGNGLGCTAWVLYNENMDYLYCDNLSWDGKTKCD